MRILRAADYTALPWKNGLGVSRVVASEPPGAGYDKIDWQVGITDIGIDCPFSGLPGMDRQFMLLTGAGVELHCIDVIAGVDVRHRVDKPFAPVSFRGDWQTTCRLVGEPVQVFNVMTRRSHAVASIAQMRWTGALFLEQKPGESVVAVLFAGAVQVTGEAAPLLPMESVVLDSPQGALREVITSGGPARLAIVRVTPAAKL